MPLNARSSPGGLATADTVKVMLFSRDKLRMPPADEALPGRSQRPFALPETHAVLGTRLEGPFPSGLAQVLVGMGCFWGAERLFWQIDGVYTTAVGYAGGFTPNPTYEEVCSGRTGHAEVVLVVFDPAKLPTDQVWKVFWEGHDPTQGMRQGNDVGTQYRSAIYVADPAAREQAEASRDNYQKALDAAGRGTITTEIADAPPLYYAEAYHQQYLAKNPGGYCGLGGTGISCPMPQS
jgi:peptide-methionine (S)-S-oxide reductase